MTSRPLKNYIGQTYGRLTVIDERILVHGLGPYMRAFVCRCTCGAERLVSQANLANYRVQTTSCNCSRKNSGRVK